MLLRETGSAAKNPAAAETRTTLWDVFNGLRSHERRYDNPGILEVEVLATFPFAQLVDHNTFHYLHVNVVEHLSSSHDASWLRSHRIRKHRIIIALSTL